MPAIFTTRTKPKTSALIKAIIFVVMTASLIGCQAVKIQGTTPPVTLPPDIQVTLLIPMTITPTAICMAVLGVNVEAVPLSLNSIHITVTGLIHNERITLVFYSEVAGQTFRIESSPVNGADTAGSIEYVESGLNKSSDVQFNEWQIQVIHSRGVACTSISLLQ